MTRRRVLLAVTGVVILLLAAVVILQRGSQPIRFSSDAYVSFHIGTYQAPGVHESVPGLPDGVTCDVISEDHGDSAKGFQIVLNDGSSMNQTTRPSEEGETVLLIGRRGFLRVKALEWVGHVRETGTVQGVRLQFDYKLPPESYSPN